MPNLYDASMIATFPASDVDEADSALDDLIAFLEKKGFEVSSTTLEPSVPILED